MIITDVRMLGTIVRQRRRALGWPQERLAKTAGVSRPWISQFEAGKPSVELGLAFAVLEVLGLHVNITQSAVTSVPSMREVGASNRGMKILSTGKTKTPVRQVMRKRSTAASIDEITKRERPAITKNGKSIAAVRARSGLSFKTGSSSSAKKWVPK